MLLADNKIGVPQDLANFITLSDEHDTPLIKRLAKNGRGEIKSRLNEYQSDVYRAPRRSNMPEGKDWSAFPGTHNRALLKARIDRFDGTGSVSVLAEDVDKANGVASDIARMIQQELTVMGREVECVLGSDQAAYEGDQAIQDRTQGMGLWIQSGTTSQVYQTPANVRPHADQIYGGTKADLHETALQELLQRAWRSTGRKDTMVGCVGPALKNRINTFPQYVPGSLSTQSTAVVSNRNLSERTLSRVVDRYAGDYGAVELEISNWLANAEFGGTTGKSDWRGYFIHPEMWDFTWHTMPTAERLAFEGGNYKFGIYAFGRLRCLNPIGEIKVDPSDA